MTLSSYCMGCLVQRQMEAIASYSDEELKSNYMKQVLTLISSSKEGDTAPVVIARINDLFYQYFHTNYSFDELKVRYNKLMLTKENEIRQKITNSSDPLLTAIKYARVGNYIDFGAMESVNHEKLNELLDHAPNEEISPLEYHCFQTDLSHADRLVYITDNCGEIVLDKLLIEQLQKLRSDLSITMIVRGVPVINDVTMEDAKQVGLTEMINVIGNGTKVAGTDLTQITPAARQAIDSADLIISKGQGNFETLHGSRKNIYYMFLCKCDWFVTRFGLERYKGVFKNECHFQN